MTRSRHLSRAGGSESLACQMDEDILKRRLAEGDRLNLAAQGFHNITHELVATRTFHANHTVDESRTHAHLRRDFLPQSFGVAGIDYHHVTTDLSLQIRRCVERRKPSLMKHAE